MKRVFISHSFEDRDLARDLARRLREAGLEPFIDKEKLTAGRKWMDEISKQIRAADAILLLLTPASLRSAFSMTELGMAEGMDRVVIPVSAGVNPAQVPAPLRSYQMIPFDRVDDAINRLSEKLMAT